MAENKKLAATFKSQDTEEWLDIHFTRPLGLLWANFFNFFGIHPNVVTILSIFLGAAAGVMFYFDNMTYTVIGILLLVWANLYDSADGQLAPAGDASSTDLLATSGLWPSTWPSVCD